MTSTASLHVDQSTPAPATPPRSAALDRLRGLAVLVMVADHLLLVGGHSDSQLRTTLTRVAMPLFAVLAGHLATRLSWRWAVVLVAGLALPLAAPWVDTPNVLVWLALGAVVVVTCRRYLPDPWAETALLCVIALGLTRYANHFFVIGPRSYEPGAVAGLMALGALTPRPILDALGRRLPVQLRVLGRYPLTVYVGHVLLLTVLTRA